MNIRERYVKIEKKGKRFLNRVKIKGKYKLYYGSLFTGFIEKHVGTIKKTDWKIITGTMESKPGITENTYVREKAIEKLLQSGQYTFGYPCIILNPYKYAPLTALALFVSDTPRVVRFTVKGKKGGPDISGETGLSKEHKVPIYGLYGGRENRVILELLDEKGKVLETKKLNILTEPLSVKYDDFFLEKSFTSPSAMPLMFITGGSIPPTLIDEKLEVRHYLDVSTSSYGVLPIGNGTVLWGVSNVGAPSFANAHTNQIQEVDFMGRMKRTLYIEKGVHHYATRLGNGNIVAISNSLEGCTEDTLVEIDYETGKVIQTVEMTQFFGEKYKDQVDWVHPNSLQYNPQEDSMLVCLRNVHAAIKFNWTTKELIWVLSIPEFWQGTEVEPKVLKPRGGVLWNYQAHSAFEMKRKQDQPEEIRRIMVFDNHRINRRPCEQFNDSQFSFINVYEVNEKENWVSLEKQFTIPKSLIRSNAVYEPESGHVFAMEGCLDHNDENQRGKILELDYDTGEVINSCVVSKDFFSIRPWSLDASKWQSSLDGRQQRIVDGLKPLEEMESLVSLEETLEENVLEDIHLSDSFLYFKAKDHAVEKFYFKGRDKDFLRDYTDTKQTTEVHKDRVYYCVISLNNLPEDEYELGICYQGKDYGIGHRISVKSRRKKS